MSKSAHTKMSTTKKLVAVDRKGTHRDQTGSRNAKRQGLEQTAQLAAKESTNFVEPVGREYTKSTRKISRTATDSGDVKRPSLDWCDCDTKVDQQCSACALLGSRQTNILGNRSDLAYMAYEVPNQPEYRRTSTTGALGQSGLPWDSRADNQRSFYYEQGSNFDRRGQVESDIWDQMQNLLASSEEIFPPANHNQDDSDYTGFQFMPDLDDIFVKHRR